MRFVGIFFYFLFFSNIIMAEEICEKYGSIFANGNTYLIQNNIWGADTNQCIEVNGTAFKITLSGHNNPTNGSPSSYPSIYKGCHYNNCTINSGMGVLVQNINSILTQWNIAAPATGAWNASLDLWFDPTNRVDGQNTGAELMIWINYLGDIRPSGQKIVSNLNLNGVQWNVWVDDNNDWNYIAYQCVSPVTDIDFDLKTFLSDALTRNKLKENWYLTSVQAGFEIWKDGADLETISFATLIDAVRPSNVFSNFLLLD